MVEDKDIEELNKIENPKDVMAMRSSCHHFAKSRKGENHGTVAFANLILVSNSPFEELPKDVSWTGFKKVLGDKNFITNLLTLEASSLSGFKARALKAYLMNDRFIPIKIAKVSVPAAKLATGADPQELESFEWPRSFLSRRCSRAWTGIWWLLTRRSRRRRSRL